MHLTSEEMELLPTAEDIAFYQEHGFYQSKKLFTDEEIATAIAGSERFYRGERDAPLPNDLNRGWQPEHGNVLRKNDYASLQNLELTALIRKPILAAIAARLAGASAIRLFHDQLLYKPVSDPNKEINVGWHTDRMYWQTCSSTSMLTAWIPFHDCDEHMGTISMIDRSNHWPDNAKNLDFFSNDLQKMEQNFISNGQPVVRVPINLRKGEVSFHSCLTIHGSGPNLSAQPRRSIAVHLQDGENHHRALSDKTWTDLHDELEGICRLVDGIPDYSDPRVCPLLWAD